MGLWNTERVVKSGWNFSVFSEDYSVVDWQPLCGKVAFQIEIPLLSKINEKGNTVDPTQFNYITPDRKLIDYFSWDIRKYLTMNKKELKILFPISVFNRSYFCYILSIILTKNSIFLFIDEHGDMSAGKIQSPISSKLYFDIRNDAPKFFAQVCNSTFLIYDLKSRVQGILEFTIPEELKTFQEAPFFIEFSYGFAGYQKQKILQVEDDILQMWNNIVAKP